MKVLRSFACVCIASALLFTTSCVSNKNTSGKSASKVAVKKDNGKHKGWYKNPNNPHNPAHSTAKNAGNSSKSAGKSNASSKSKSKK